MGQFDQNVALFVVDRGDDRVEEVQALVQLSSVDMGGSEKENLIMARENFVTLVGVGQRPRPIEQRGQLIRTAHDQLALIGQIDQRVQRRIVDD